MMTVTIVVVVKPRMTSMTKRAVKRNNDKYNDNNYKTLKTKMNLKLTNTIMEGKAKSRRKFLSFNHLQIHSGQKYDNGQSGSLGLIFLGKWPSKIS